MKRYLVILVLIAFASAAVKVSPLKCNLNGALVKCSSKLDQVCGISIKDGKQIRSTYVNSCQSCAIGKVDFYLPQSCDKYPKEAVFCTPEQKKSKMCTREYSQSCGWFGENVQCIAAPCAIEASNGCVACANSDVVYYTPGACKKAN